jgi:DNA-binding NarL/FixJ family response regulator
MNKKTKILIADDHPLMRDGLEGVLKSELNFEISAKAKDGEQAYNLLKEQDFDIVTLDIEMPKISGLEIARKIKEENIDTKIVFLTMYKDEDMFNEAMDSGAFGYVLKENAVEDIIDCIKSVAKGEYYISPGISRYLVKRQNELKKFGQENHSINSLTKTERLILRLVSQEKTTKEIAERLFISAKTVENHRANISKKLNLHGSHSLIKFAINNKTIL